MSFLTKLIGLPTEYHSQFKKMTLMITVLFGGMLVAWLSQPIIDQQRPVPFYLPLHAIMEVLSISVAFMVFAVGWNVTDKSVSRNVLILGVGFLVVGLFDLMHTLSYNGMPDFFTPNDGNKHITFWLAARMVAAVTLLIVAFQKGLPFSHDTNTSHWVKLAIRNLWVGAISIFFLLMNYAAFHGDIFPTWYTPGVGLTQVKKSVEYFIIFLYFAASILFITRRNKDSMQVNFILLCSATLTMALGEIFFTLYTNMLGIYNILGHAYKVIAYYLIYRAVVVQVVEEPYKQLQVINEHVTHLAQYDVLTGLINRQFFREQIDQLILESATTNTQFAILFFDLDHFKKINDTLGHQVGDALLIEVSKRLQAGCRQRDRIARVGGDEFVYMLHAVDHQTASILVSRILEQFSKPLLLEGSEVNITASIGMSLYPEDGRDFETLVQHADIAMYRAKRNGRNTFCFFTAAMQDEANYKVIIENALRTAVSNNELTMYYQPQISLMDNTLIGAESLIRWHHKTMGHISPAVFIPIAETTGQIIHMGEWILDTVATQVSAWRAANVSAGTIAINISAVQFKQENLPSIIFKVLEKTGAKTTDIELELTETAAMDVQVDAVSLLNNLNSGGLRIALDDFGTGYSSLSMMKKFKIYRIKIDQSFVRDITDYYEDQAIVRAIIDMSHALGFKTIAEGVETKEQLRILKELGCDEAQGYYISRPIPAAEYEQFIHTYQSKA